VPPLLWEVDMQGIEKEDAEEAFRRGYEHAAIETFHAIEQFLDPSTRRFCEPGLRRTFTSGG
jgi:hypothetical protein